MKKKLLTILFSALLLFQTSLAASLEEAYPKDAEKTTIYYFGTDCAHCKEAEQYLNDLENVFIYEIKLDKEGLKLAQDALKKRHAKESLMTPLIIINDQYFMGFSKTIKQDIDSYLNTNKRTKLYIPFLGSVNAKSVSIILTSIILGFIDGFNPCAMWILIYLISLLMMLDSRKKQFLYGYSFLIFSAFFYLLAMYGVQFLLGLEIKNIKLFLGIILLAFGLNNLIKLISAKEGCSNDKDQRKKVKHLANKVISSKTIGALFFLLLLALMINTVELGCSLGFPLIFNEILTINNIQGLHKFFYLLIYVLFYMMDDIIVFTVSMVLLKPVAISLKVEKRVKLVGAVLMILMAICLIFFPNILMFS